MIEEQIAELIETQQYSIPQKDKEKAILEICKVQLKEMIKKNKHLASMYEKLGVNPDNFTSLEDIPYIPVQMFKDFDLSTVNEEEIVRVLKSSATTSQTPSKVPIDKITAQRQTKGLAATMQSYLGKKRRHFLVIDTESVNAKNSDIVARGVAIRGLSTFAKSITYVLKEDGNKLVLDTEKLKEFCEQHKGEEVYLFGFTFIIWSIFVQELKDKLDCSFEDVKVFHSGGWKKLKEQKVSEEIFSEKLASIFNTTKGNIVNFYGMAEQTGVIFLDCSEGHKHVANFADVIVRDYQTMKEEINKPGLIEVLSVLGNSYPAQALLTEDVGQILGIDDCPCGKKGKYFKFLSRVEKAEVRGCGDTFAEK